MQPWLTRGLVMALVHAVGSVAVAKFDAVLLGERSVVVSVAFALLMGVSLTWGAVDGWLRLENPAKTWLIASIIAGPVAGVGNVIGRAIFVDNTGVDALGPQLTTGAAFVAMLVLAPAAAGVLFGRRLEPPRVSRAPDQPDAATTPDR